MPSSTAHSAPQRWDIFCTVVDNYGDIGVCWRLARQLVAEHGVAARLWVDDLGAFARICPEIDPERDSQSAAGVDVRHWSQPFPAPDDPADVVIEAFACELPEAYVAAMARRQPAPRWINLEYLSAEPWVADCHGLPSPHPRLPLTKHFFIPGFDENSAGLLRERDLLARHAGFDAPAWWAQHGGAPACGSLAISLFAYENNAVAALLNAWRSESRPVRCLVTDSRVLNSVSAAAGTTLVPGDVRRDGALDLRILPFMRQEAYDDLLAACDLNFVRGEDSLVRAIWAGKPFVWHIYPQDDAAHRVKLDAFLDRYCAGLSIPANDALRTFWHGWNAETLTADQWRAFAGHLPEIVAHTRNFRDRLAQLPDLAKTLADFCADPV
ncbi:elongation factor P maturation arginine rhamnosyltransferase EarP [Azospira restricta]|uniref:Protein-arginine rhamnosyltransferase n=1 Tax=Azospira restricta TaxID=404405 RepID=A0A974PWI8_9RHOO|nr:elongation factor P maturation arginine rhamnosyltransferase EarP [Azospira restricta]QRJ62792.1 elongation factor P maturation arginine rhamnosyltransferase EarP [Azospira restricta]